MNDWIIGMVCMLALGFAFWLGWASAHSTVKLECERLGGFYVGQHTLKCEVTK